MERKEYTYTEKKDTRSGFGDGLTELGKTNEKHDFLHFSFVFFVFSWMFLG